jgi:tetratricopeptide (TPR) repeat protein
MLRRLCWLWVGLLFLGCHCVPGGGPTEEEPARRLWQEGQDAMRQGEPQRAVGYFERSLQSDPSLTRNHLSLAAAHLETGDDATACGHLARYVAAHPEHLEARAQYAELLLRLGRGDGARDELARLAGDLQELGRPALNRLVQCHSRLLQIAEERHDEYEMHLHRGIGLYHLARQRAALDDPTGELPVEGLLCRAAGALTLARMLRPDEARPCWYLHAVWARLGQRQPAQRWLQAAAAAAPFSELTPAEQRALVLACRTQDTERR